MNKLITIASFQYLHQAYMIKSNLEANGIFVLVIDEITIQADNFLPNPNRGVRLQVFESDYERALSIIKNLRLLDGDLEEQKPSPKYVLLLEKLTHNIPVIKKWPLIVRIPTLVVFPLIISMIVLMIAALPPKEERIAARKEAKKRKEEEKLYSFYLPQLDTLVFTDPSLAISTIDNLQSIHPEDVELTFLKGIAYANSDSFLLSINEFEKSMKLAGYEHADGLFNIALSRINMNEYDSAITVLNKAVELDWRYYYDLGDVYELKGDDENAILYYQKYIEKMEDIYPYIIYDKEYIKFKARIRKKMNLLNSSH